MAIDTAEKRKSISGIPFLIVGVTPNATKDSEWRTQVAWSYSGISISAPVVMVAHYIYIVAAESRIYVVPFVPEEPRIYEVEHD